MQRIEECRDGMKERDIYIYIMVVLFAMSSFTNVVAQADIHVSQYWRMAARYNPAWAGQSGRLNAVGSYTMRPVRSESNPQSIYLGADIPLGSGAVRQGVGAGYEIEEIGIMKSRDFRLQYSCGIRLGSGTLALGAQVGSINIAIDSTSTSSVSSSKIDAAAGVCYTSKSLNIGAGVQHLTSPSVDLGNYTEQEMEKIKLKTTLYLYTAYNIEMRNPSVYTVHSLMAKSDFGSVRVDISDRIGYSHNGRRIEGGVSYSPGKSVAIFAGGVIKHIEIGYSYEMLTSKDISGRSIHELTVGYKTDIALWGNRKSNYRHKSVRIL
jgi:type IX secretion system PorP/SprF family membrane protein